MLVLQMEKEKAETLTSKLAILAMVQMQTLEKYLLVVAMQMVPKIPMQEM